MKVRLSRAHWVQLRVNLSVEQKEGKIMSEDFGRYHSTRTDSPPALSAAATLQLLAVWTI